MQDISSRMDAVCRRFEELSIRLNQPDTAADPALFRKLMREYHDTEPVVEAYRDWQTALDHLAQAKALLEEPGSLDPDFKQMIQQEISEKSQDVAKLENNLKILLLPRDPRDEKNVIMEIRGGAGGEEAALFAHSLLRMYTMYVQSRGWTLELLNLNETELASPKHLHKRNYLIKKPVSHNHKCNHNCKKFWNKCKCLFLNRCKCLKKTYNKSDNH